VAAYNASKGGDAVVEPHEEEVSDEAEVGALDSDAESESDDEGTSPVTAPLPPVASKTPRPNKRQKIAATPQVNGSSAPASTALGPTPVPLPSDMR